MNKEQIYWHGELIDESKTKEELLKVISEVLICLHAGIAVMKSTLGQEDER